MPTKRARIPKARLADQIDLVARMRRSDPGAIDEFLSDWDGAIRWSVTRAKSTWHDFDDVYQDFVLSLLQHIDGGKWDPDRSSLMSWISMMARYHCRSLRWKETHGKPQLRQASVLEEGEVKDVEDERPGPMDEAERFDTQATVHRAMRHLGPKGKRATSLHLAGLSRFHIARRMELSECRVSEILKDARASMKRTLEGWGVRGVS